LSLYLKEFLFYEERERPAYNQEMASTADRSSRVAPALDALLVIDAESRKEWIAAPRYDRIAQAGGRYCGTQKVRRRDTPNNIEATRKYIRDFDRIASHTKTALELYSDMLAIYPESVNPTVLWISAQAVKPGT
jgi:hypothetical protein